MRKQNGGRSGMIYDKILTIYTLLPARSPAVRRLAECSRHYYAERTVYASRFYAGKQAGAKLVRMVSMPRSIYDSPIDADQYCVLDDGHVYRIDQAQREYDDDGLPVTTLSLAEPEGKYELLKN